MVATAYFGWLQIWSLKHRLLGVVLMVLSSVNIFSGMSEHSVDTVYRWLFAIWLMLIACAFIVLHTFKACNAHDQEVLACTPETVMDNVENGSQVGKQKVFTHDQIGMNTKRDSK